MKKNLLFISCLFLWSLCAQSQNNLNLVIFSEDGDQFFAYINGVKQNQNPESNVKVTNLTSQNISLRIEFNDKNLPQLKQNMSLDMGFEHTAKITRDMKKQLKLRYFGKTPIDQSTNAGSTAVQYNTADNSGTNNNSTQTTDNTITTTSSQTYNTNDNPNGNVNINMGVAGISMTMDGTNPGGATMNSTTSTTVTNTSTSGSNYSSTGSGTNNYNNTTSSSTPGKAPCDEVMTAPNFAKMKQSVEAKPFSDTKMSTAKVATKNACLSVNQVKEISKLFSMDDDKLSYAKYAYDYCVDKANFYQLSEVFSFSTTTDALNKFLEDK